MNDNYNKLNKLYKLMYKAIEKGIIKDLANEFNNINDDRELREYMGYLEVSLSLEEME